MSKKLISRLVIIKYPDPRLRKKSLPVTEFDEELSLLAQHMLEQMRQANGVGLAAPQLGLLKRIFVCNATTDPKNDMILVNPELSDLEGIVEAEEGCLSIPGVSVCVRRASRCRIRAQDIDGKSVEYSAADLLARVWQHETDHLNGKLILDYMTQTSKLSNRKALQQLEENYQPKTSE